MPLRSEAQRRYLYMKFGAAWMDKHHFDQKGPLPPHVVKKIRHKARKRRRA